MHVAFATEPAHPGADNEDFAAATPYAVVVLDGVTTAGTETGCRHGTAWYARHLGGTLIADLSAHPEHKLTDLLAIAIDTVAGRHRHTCDLTHPGTPASTVVIARERPGALDYLVLADSVLILDQPGGPTIITDDRESTVSVDLHNDVHDLQAGTPEHDTTMQALMTDLQLRRNQPGGFWVAAADPTAAAEAITGTLPTSNLAALAALTDGATRVADRFHLIDWPKLLAVLATDGPADLIRRNRDAEASDPHGRRWKRGKLSDDATAAYCTGFARLGH